MNLWEILSETGLSREAKKRVCSETLEWLRQKVHAHDCTEHVGYTYIEGFCALPAKEPEKPPLHCARCGMQFGAGDAVEGCARVACYPACPPKEDKPLTHVLGQHIQCTRCGHCIVTGGYRYTDKTLCDSCYDITYRPEALGLLPKPEVEGLDGIVHDGVSYGDMKRRIVEAVCKLYSEWGKACDGRPFVADVEKWGGVVK